MREDIGITRPGRDLRQVTNLGPPRVRHAAGVWFVQTGQQAEERSFPAAVTADEGDFLLRLHAEGDAAKNRLCSIALRQVAGSENGHPDTLYWMTPIRSRKRGRTVIEHPQA